MADTTTGEVAAALAGIRRDAEDETAGLGPTRRASRRDVPRLLAGYDALLKLADDWYAKGAKILGQIELQDCDGALAAFKMIAGQRYQDCAKELRAVISRELLSKEDSHGR